MQSWVINLLAPVPFVTVTICSHLMFSHVYFGICSCHMYILIVCGFCFAHLIVYSYLSPFKFHRELKKYLGRQTFERMKTGIFQNAPKIWGIPKAIKIWFCAFSLNDTTCSFN